MKLIVDPQIFQTFPNLKLGAIVIKGMDNSRRVSALESLLRGVCAQKGKEMANQEIHDHPMIAPWNQAYGKFGVNPKKYPCSIAALLKRVKSGKEIPHINPLVDLYNYYSLKNLLPIGGEDLDWLCGDLKLTFTKSGEPFRALGSIEVDQAKEGEVAYIDQGGITCRYWNHRECERTKFTEKTKNAVLIIEDLSDMHLDKFGQLLREIQNSIIKYIGGQIEPYIITEDSNQIDLGIEGRKNVDDAKISSQEKAYLLEKQKRVQQKIEEKTSSKEEKPQPAPQVQKKKPSRITTQSPDLIQEQLKSLTEIAVTKAFPKAVDVKAEIDYPKDQSHGDYASNIALQLAKPLKVAPKEIAEKIAAKVETGSLIEKVEIAGPGFINFYLSKKQLDQNITTILKEKDNYGKSQIGKDKNIIVEYSAPNIAKPLGVHHLLSTIIGQTLHDLYKFLGFNSIGINYIGDWGTQFGKLITAYKKWGKKSQIEKDPIPELLKLYVKFHDEAEKSPELLDQARKEFKNFEEGDKENRALWQWFVDESLKDIKKTYDKLGNINFDLYQGESFAEDKMEAVVKEGRELGIFVKGEEGALIAEYEDPNMPPFVVLKKDGATLYSTRDFTHLKHRITHWHPIKILYVVDIAQSLHFQQIFQAAERFPWYHEEGEHVSFGRMQLKDKKMSTRKGTVVLLDDVLDEATERAQKIIKEKSPDLKNAEEVAKVVGIGAIKYNILSQNRNTNITFEWDRMLSFEGNSSPYLQYSYARAKSILRKSQDKTDKPLKDPKETATRIRNLISLFPKFPEHVAAAAQEYKPNILGNYLYELAQRFNTFYSQVPVIKAADKDKEYRLKIVEATSQILKNGLKLLGIDVVEEM